jgi:hypothetical protein
MSRTLSLPERVLNLRKLSSPDDLFGMSERRYNEAEVAAIFERAAEAQKISQSQLPSGEGMTLAEIQEIGREVGFSPEQLTNAAKAVAFAPRATSRRFFGLPVGVGLTVDLDRKLTEAEWERLVVDLRETFDARGRLGQEGSFRQWSNGNLQALVEPTPDGDRLRMRTIKGDSRSLMTVGIGMLGLSAVGAIATATGANLGGPAILSAPAVIASIGAALFAIGGLQLPGWAERRRQQMQDIASRVSVAPPR